MKVFVSVIKKYFEDNGVPKKAFRLNKCTVVNDPELFVRSHLAYLKRNKKNRTYLAYYDRLLFFYEKCIQDEKQRFL